MYKWTKLYRAYDVEKFTGSDNNIDNDSHRYSFTTTNGTVVLTDNKSNFLNESNKAFLGWHSDDMRSAFPFKTFDNIEQAKSYFNLQLLDIHLDKIIGTKFALYDVCTLLMTIEFKSEEEWNKFVEYNHDPEHLIAHGMKTYGPFMEYDRDHPGHMGHVS